MARRHERREEPLRAGNAHVVVAFDVEADGARDGLQEPLLAPHGHDAVGVVTITAVGTSTSPIHAWAENEPMAAPASSTWRQSLRMTSARAHSPVPAAPPGDDLVARSTPGPATA